MNALEQIEATITWLEQTREADSISQGQQPAQHPHRSHRSGGEEAEDVGLLLTFRRILPVAAITGHGAEPGCSMLHAGALTDEAHSSPYLP